MIIGASSPILRGLARGLVFLFGCIVPFAAGVLVGPAAGEVYFSDSGVEISGTGTRMSRNCTIVLKPTQTFGDNLAPRLSLVTSGPSRLSFGIDGPAQYSSSVIVQNNVRRPLFGMENASIEQFRLSEIGKALKSQRLFFVTAQRSDSGKFVSSRYEQIDFDAIMAKVEAACPFDAESLVTDLSSRERAERALSISSSDLTLVRWALNKKYGGSSNRPEQTSSLSQQERTYLKRYAGDNGLPLSQYLTADIARRLTLEGQLIASSAVTPPVPAVASAERTRQLPKADLSGTVTGAQSAARLVVDKKIIDLFGIIDSTVNLHSHTTAVLRYLTPSHGRVECYTRPGGKFQCFVNGEDLALLALRDAIAKPGPDAPPHYRGR